MSPASFENVKEKWLPEVHHHCPGVPCIIVGTQIDLREDPTLLEKLARQKQKPVEHLQGDKLARELGAVKYVTFLSSHLFALLGGTKLMSILLWKDTSSVLP